MNSRIVGQIVRHRLVAMAQVARAVRRVHDLHRGFEAVLGGPVFRRQRQRILNVSDILLKHRQLAALRVIADQHGSAEGSLHAQQTVVVGLIRSEDHVELRDLSSRATPDHF